MDMIIMAVFLAFVIFSLAFVAMIQGQDREARRKHSKNQNKQPRREKIKR